MFLLSYLKKYFQLKKGVFPHFEKVQKNESGRTMVEMLAVIVIVGVLTVGGITANSIANRLFRENIVYEEVETLISGITDTYSWARSYSDLNDQTVCDNEIVAGICICDEIKKEVDEEIITTKDNCKLKNVFGGSITIHPADNGQTFLIKYANVPSTVTEKLEEKAWQNAYIVRSTCSGDICSVIFAPDDGADRGTEEGSDYPIEDSPCQNSYDCDIASCEVCDDGICVAGCVEDEVCISGSCRAPICKTNSDCQENSAKKYCAISNDPRNNTCVECLKNNHCDEAGCYHCANGNCTYKCEPGQVCSNGSCSMVACTTDSQCLLQNPSLPYCLENATNPFKNKCIECKNDTHCDPMKCYTCQNSKCAYACDPNQVCLSGVCSDPVCQNDEDCRVKDATKPYCQQRAYADDNTCVACYKNEHCDQNACYVCGDNGGDPACVYACNDNQWCDEGRCRNLEDTATLIYETTTMELTPEYVTRPIDTATFEITTLPEETRCLGFWGADGECYLCDYSGDVLISNAEKESCRSCGRRVEKNMCLNEQLISCQTNDDCTNTDYYCDVPAQGSAGTCEPATFDSVTVNNTKYRTKDTSMSWVSTQNYCARVGGTQITLGAFGCGYNTGFCSSKNMQSFIGSNLQGEYWTATADDSSNSYMVQMSSGYINKSMQTDRKYPLCVVSD